MRLSLLATLFVIRAAAEPYFAVYAGAAKTHASDVTIEQPARRFTFRQVPFRGRSFESPQYYGYRAGVFLNRHFGLEAEFIHLKIYAEVDEVPDMRQQVQHFEVSHGLNLVLINAVARRSIGPIIATARVGAGPTVPRPEVTVFGQSGGEYQLGPIATQAAGGLQLRLWRGLYALTEYKYTYTPSAFDVPGGRASVRVHSHHWVGGFSVHLGRQGSHVGQTTSTATAAPLRQAAYRPPEQEESSARQSCCQSESAHRTAATRKH